MSILLFDLNATNAEDDTSPSHYFTIEEFRERYPELTVDKGYTDAKIADWRATAEEAFEDAARVAFVPRTRTQTGYVGTWNRAMVLVPRLRSVTAATVDGTDLTADELSDLQLDPAGVVTRGCGTWHGQVTVTYTYGYDAPPLRVKQAVMILTKTWMVQGPVDDRATQISTEDGPINLATPGVFGAVFGVPECDAVLRQYGIGAYVA